MRAWSHCTGKNSDDLPLEFRNLFYNAGSIDYIRKLPQNAPRLDQVRRLPEPEMQILENNLAPNQYHQPQSGAVPNGNDPQEVAFFRAIKKCKHDKHEWNLFEHYLHSVDYNDPLSLFKIIRAWEQDCVSISPLIWLSLLTKACIESDPQ